MSSLIQSVLELEELTLPNGSEGAVWKDEVLFLIIKDEGETTTTVPNHQRAGGLGF